MSHLAISAFCWLPPERNLSGRWTLGVLSVELADAFADGACLTPFVNHARCRASRTGEDRERDVGRDRHVHDRALPRRSSGRSDKPRRMACRGCETSPGGRPSRSRPSSRGSAPNTIRTISLRPEPTRPARPRISPDRRSKETSRTRPPEDCEPGARAHAWPGWLAVREDIAVAASDDALDQRLLVHRPPCHSVEITCPSFITVTRSVSSRISSSRCET